MKHNICGHEWSPRPTVFLGGSRCPICSRMTIEERIEKYLYIKNYIEVESNSGCELITKEYLTSDKKYKIKCKCGNIFEKKWEKFIKRQQQCKKCGINARTDDLRKDNELFKKEIYDLVGEEYSVLGKYVHLREKILFKHNTCGNEFMVSPVSFIGKSGKNGTRCPICFPNKTLLKTTEGFKKEVFNMLGDEYSILSEYTGAYDTVLVKHNKCGHKWDIVPHYLIGNSNIDRLCPSCYVREKQVKTTEGFKKEVFNLVKNEYDVIEEYINTHTKILFRHNICGHEWSTTPRSFLGTHNSGGSRCPKCFNNSKGSIVIRNILDGKNVIYKTEYRFDECKNINRLPFDFAIFDKNNTLTFLIEYDGEQHWKPLSFSSDNTQKTKNNNFINQMIRDEIKDKFCKDNNIKLIRIPYFQYKDIESILENEIKL